jgi:hypothetical protein
MVFGLILLTDLSASDIGPVCIVGVVRSLGCQIYRTVEDPFPAHLCECFTKTRRAVRRAALEILLAQPLSSQI